MSTLALLTFLLVLQVPFVVGASLGLLMAVLVPLWVFIGLRALELSQMRLTRLKGVLTRGDSSFQIALGLVGAMMVVSYFRAALAGSVPAPEAVHQALLLITVVLFGLTVFRRGTPADHGAEYLLAAVGIYLLANALLHLAGWKGSVSDDVVAGVTARMLSSFGILTERTLFPSAGGLNNFGAVAGLAIAGGIVQIGHARSTALRVVAALIVSVGLYVVLRTDSRAALIFSLLVGIGVSLIPTRALRVARFGAAVIPMLPFALFASAVLIATLIGSSAFVRNPQEIYSLGSRAIIWAAIGAELSGFSPTHLVGFGYFGQTQSTIVQYFGDVVGAGYDTGRLTAHNMVLQQVLDIGYVGALAVLSLFWFALSRIDRVAKSQRKLVVALLLYLLLSGVTEATPTPYYRECFVLFLLLITFVLSSSGNKERSTPRTASPNAGNPKLMPKSGWSRT